MYFRQHWIIILARATAVSRAEPPLYAAFSVRKRFPTSAALGPPIALCPEHTRVKTEDSMPQQKRIFRLGLMALVVWLMPVSSSAGADPQRTANEKAAEDHVKRGTALFAKGNLDGAIAEYRAAIRLSHD